MNMAWPCSSGHASLIKDNLFYPPFNSCLLLTTAVGDYFPVVYCPLVVKDCFSVGLCLFCGSAPGDVHASKRPFCFHGNRRPYTTEAEEFPSLFRTFEHLPERFTSLFVTFKEFCGGSESSLWPFGELLVNIVCCCSCRRRAAHLWEEKAAFLTKRNFILFRHFLIRTSRGAMWSRR